MRIVRPLGHPRAAVPLEGVRHLARLGQDADPLSSLLFGCQFSEVLDDRRRIARFEGNLVGALHLGDAVSDE